MTETIRASGLSDESRGRTVGFRPGHFLSREREQGDGGARRTESARITLERIFPRPPRRLPETAKREGGAEKPMFRDGRGWW